MEQLNKLIFLSLIIVCISACYNNSAVKTSKINGQDFISCNIDKIKETFNLNLSDIAEYSEVVILKNDSVLKVEDYQIERVVVSDKYIVVMPRLTPALLYTRKGKFIKKLTPFGSSNSEELYGIHAQIDDERDMVYLLVCGLKLLRFNVYDFN
ncbi:MAG TPA: hypothetical protein ENN33_14350, partial [Ignavibacteria bacterium]|nr:hypothetical protein [Ignavibacteria bacterium]